MALHIFQTWLDAASAAFITDRFDDYRQLVTLPLEMTSDHSTVVMSTDDMLRQVFDQYLDLMRSQHATDLIRTARDARFDAEDTVVGTYRTDILRQGQRIMDPFLSSLMLRRSAGVWRATHLTSGLPQAHWRKTMQTKGATAPTTDIPGDAATVTRLSKGSSQ